MVALCNNARERRAARDGRSLPGGWADLMRRALRPRRAAVPPLRWTPAVDCDGARAQGDSRHRGRTRRVAPHRRLIRPSAEIHRDGRREPGVERLRRASVYSSHLYGHKLTAIDLPTEADACQCPLRVVCHVRLCQHR